MKIIPRYLFIKSFLITFLFVLFACNSTSKYKDIDSLINARSFNKAQKSAVLQHHRALQYILSVDTNNIKAVKAVNLLTSRSIHCIYSVFDKAPAEVSKKISFIVFNTGEKITIHQIFSESLSGTGWSMPKGNTCELGGNLMKGGVER